MTQRRKTLTGVVAASLLILAGWLVIHPYAGIQHDAILYSASALRSLYPENYAGDFFFGAGTQFEFTVFPAVLSRAVAWFGLGGANQVLLIAGHALWLGAVILLVRRLAGRSAAWLAMWCVVALPSSFGGFGVLSYGEPFLTPRVFAEGFALLAMFAVVSGRPVIAALVLVVGLTLHPLVTLGAAGVVVLFLLLRDRRYGVVLVAALLAMLASAIADLSPFGGLLKTFDPVWRTTLEQRSTYLFLRQWEATTWFGVAFDMALLWLAATLSSDVVRRLFLAMLFAGIAGFAIAFIGTDLIGDVLLTQLQPWRVGWVVRLGGNIALAVVLVRLSADTTASGRFNFVLLSASAFMLLSAHVVPLNIIPATICGVTAVLLAQLRAAGRLRELPRAMLRACSGLLIGLLAFACFGVVGFTYRWWLSFAQWPSSLRGIPDIWLYWAMLVVGPFAAYAMLKRTIGFRRPVWLATAVVLAFVAIVSWDRRSDWDRMIEESTIDASAPGIGIPREASVYWEDDIKIVWFLLRRASYFSLRQGAGVVFDPDRSRVFRHRHAIIEPLETYDTIPLFHRDQHVGLRDRQLTRQTLHDVCSDPDGPDYVVLLLPIAGVDRVVWVPPVPRMMVWRGPDGPLPELIDEFSIYDCARVAAGN